MTFWQQINFKCTLTHRELNRLLGWGSPVVFPPHLQTEKHRPCILPFGSEGVSTCDTT